MAFLKDTKKKKKKNFVRYDFVQSRAYGYKSCELPIVSYCALVLDSISIGAVMFFFCRKILNEKNISSVEQTFFGLLL